RGEAGACIKDASTPLHPSLHLTVIISEIITQDIGRGFPPKKSLEKAEKFSLGANEIFTASADRLLCFLIAGWECLCMFVYSWFQHSSSTLSIWTVCVCVCVFWCVCVCVCVCVCWGHISGHTTSEGSSFSRLVERKSVVERESVALCGRCII